jgi:Zn-dependent protease with chaperone function
MGHVINKHTKSKNPKILQRLIMSIFSVDKREIQADQYAFELCGKNNAINSLQHMFNITKSIELKRRIKIIQNYN